MEVFRDTDSLGKYLSAHACQGHSVGLVPTMGALHQGHLSLLENAHSENDLVVCSIYVNPTQFNNAEDLDTYPRQEQKDLEILENAGCQAVFAPPDTVMYEAGPEITISFGESERIMEGKFRPGHFNGVALVVSKLLNAVRPDRVYFGQKDLQQYILVSKLIRDLGFRTECRCIPIYREESGLALSSRNQRLSEEERTRAREIYKMLKDSANRLKNGELWGDLQQQGINYLKSRGLEPEYFEAVDAETLAPVTNDFSGKKVALCVAACVGNVRLIDNLILGGSN